MAKKIISISLYGDSPVYFNGVIANAKLVPKIFPGWTMRVYCEMSNIDLTPLVELDCEIIRKPESRLHSGMFWRFLAAWDNEAERAIFRDADSRLNVKEAEAVKAWEESGLDAHCMKDHLHHTIKPMSGGMWGIKCRILPRQLLREVLKKARQSQKRVKDMHWLRDNVHPLIKDSLLRHSSFPSRWPSVPFPPHPEYEGFVGQQYDELDNPIYPGENK
ncbi:MAG: hypothetical protein ACTSO3_01275 [Candidatus Heimdallarchaeaceae archaeon]